MKIVKVHMFDLVKMGLTNRIFPETRCMSILQFGGADIVLCLPQKNTKRSLKTTFIQDYLDKRPFYKFNVRHLISF
jgi:hypothetical protein